MERLRFQLLVENRDPHPTALRQKKGRQYERLPNSERATKWEGLQRACCSGKRTGRQNCPGALCPAGWELLRNFRCSIPLAGYPALKPSTMICSLLQLLASWHWFTNQLPLPWHQSSQGSPCLQQLQRQSTEGYTCVLGPLVCLWRGTQ